MAFRTIQTTNLQSTQTSFSDPVVVVGKDNTTATDIGFLGKIGTDTYSGLVRDVETQKYYLIENYTSTESNNDISPVLSDKSTLVLERIEAPELYGNVTGDLDGYIRDTNGNVLLNNEHGNAGFGGNIYSSGASSFSGSVDFSGATISGFNGTTTGTHTGNVVGNLQGNIINAQGQPVIDNSGALYPTIIQLPRGIESERPSPASEGMMFFNSTTKMFEGYNGTEWVQFVPSDYEETP